MALESIKAEPGPASRVIAFNGIYKTPRREPAGKPRLQPQQFTDSWR